MASSTTILLAILCLFALLPSVSAFGAGEIPDFAFLADKAFRHLDIENILTNIVRWKGSKSGGSSLIGAAVNFIASGGAEKTFTKADVQRVYFGNWLRDYSQAMDIAGLSNATAETIILLLSVLSFMTFGYATEEFELKAQRLGVYLPVEHIYCLMKRIYKLVDNPKGYGGKEDPRKYHRELRPPINPRELEIDSRTGMKNYIANDGQGWDTSASHVRRSLEKAIQLARQSGGHRSPELYEAYRLMGGALHTLEDLLAHSNWIELSLRKLGCNEVFCHVGDGVTVNAPGGQRVPPLVTGTFGSADFIFSVMGEAGDKLSESSVSELSKKIANSQGQQSSLATVKTLLGQVNASGGDTGNEIDKAEQIQKKAYSFNPDNYTTEEVQATLWDIMVWRDNIMRKVSVAIEKIPGLENYLEELTAALNIYIYTTIEPYVKPVLMKVNDGLGAGSRLVIDQDDQYEVFDNPSASDPSHSMLSKDHFDNILNEPAGKIAKVVVEVAVNKIVDAWSDNNVDVRRTIDDILKALHHPYFADERCEIQMAMAQTLRKWYDGLGNDQRETIRRLSKESVRDGKNKRIGADENTPMHSHTVGSHQHHGGQSGGGGYAGSGGRGQQQPYGSGGDSDPSRQQQQYGSGAERQRYPGITGQQQQQQQYGGGTQQSYTRRDDDNSYNRGAQQTQYGGGGATYGQRDQDEPRTQQTQYGGGTATYGRRDEDSSYGSRTQQTQYGGSGTTYGRRDDDSYNSRTQQTQYGGASATYGGRNESQGHNTASQQSQYGAAGATYGGQSDYNSGNTYGSSRRDDDGHGGRREREDTHGEGYGRHDQHHEQSYGRQEERETSYGGSGGRRDEYGSGGHDNYGQSGGYGRQQETSGYGRQQESSGYGRQESRRDEHGGGYGGGGSRRDNDDTYGVERLNISGGYGGGRRDEGQSGYGGRSRDDDSDEEKRRKKYEKKHKDNDDSDDDDKKKKKYQGQGRRYDDNDSDDDKHGKHGGKHHEQSYGRY
ncbi:hypothetical protein FRC17_010009 [Serendipita sp. 399]|nr:hypothetical protein FRC17_010009 [Serendipita sp. 399]